MWHPEQVQLTELVEDGINDLNLYSNNAGVDDFRLGLLVTQTSDKGR